jgi:hypothetical protein
MAEPATARDRQRPASEWGREARQGSQANSLPRPSRCRECRLTSPAQLTVEHGRMYARRLVCTGRARMQLADFERTGERDFPRFGARVAEASGAAFRAIRASNSCDCRAIFLSRIREET